MSFLKLFKTDKLSGNRKREVYKCSLEAMECSRIIFLMTDFQKREVRVTIAGEEMKADERKIILSFRELQDISDNSVVSSCVFQGRFNNEDIDVVVDYDLKRINVVAKHDETIALLIKQMED